jgi:hypothetical protein
VRLGPEDRGRLDAEYRRFLIALGVRIALPRDGERRPGPDVGGAPPDTAGPSAGWYRPPHRRQDPSSDPAEPTDESGDTGHDHGWSNCTMSAGSMVLAFHTQGRLGPWGGDLRHSPSQPDMTGGTDLYDVAAAWTDYGEALQVRTGAGWEGVRMDREAGRALILTGTGNVPGAATFDGGHAIAILPETRDDGAWLQGDPLCTGYEWVTESALRAWAERLEPTVNYARSAAHPPAGGYAEDVMFNVAPMTTHRDAIVRDCAVLYRDSALSVRHSVATGDTALAFIGSTNDAHIVVNAGSTNYVRRTDVVDIITADREHT